MWDARDAAPLFAWKLPSAAPAGALAPEAAGGGGGGSTAGFVRGLAFHVSMDGGVQLCAGTSSGDIVVVDVSLRRGGA